MSFNNILAFRIVLLFLVSFPVSESSSKSNKPTKMCRNIPINFPPRVKTYVMGIHPKTGNVTLATWYEAQVFCRISHMTPATIDSKEDFYNFKKITSNIGEPNTNQLFWTDGTVLGKKTHRCEDFYWFSTFKPITNSHFWLVNEPNNLDNNEDCVDFFRTKTHDHALNDSPCQHLRYFVCQKYN